MTLPVGPLPAGDERHDEALQAAATAMRHGQPFDGSDLDTAVYYDTVGAVAAYHRSLAEQGVRLVDASEVAEWLRNEELFSAADDFLARFGGGDEG